MLRPIISIVEKPNTLDAKTTAKTSTTAATIDTSLRGLRNKAMMLIGSNSELRISQPISSLSAIATKYTGDLLAIVDSDGIPVWAVQMSWLDS